MMRRLRVTFGLLGLGLLLAFPTAFTPGIWLTEANAQGPEIPHHLKARAHREGAVRVIVELNLPGGAPVPEGEMFSGGDLIAQRRDIANAQSRVLSKLGTKIARVLHKYESVPLLTVEVDFDGLNELETNPDVRQVMEDALAFPTLIDSGPLIQADQAWTIGQDGTGTVIAVLDTGVDSSHPFLTGKVIEEACYSSTVPGRSDSLCPNGQSQQTGPGAATPCTLYGCFHGTHVAGTAAGNGAGAGQSFSGVARGAQIMAIQVFSRITDRQSCGGFPPCLGAYTSDIIAGLERVYVRRAQLNIASVNLSLAGGLFSSPCDTQPHKAIIDNLRSVRIPAVAASGNNGSLTSMGSPACISSAVSVASTTKMDVVSSFSNVAPFLLFFAPGDEITSSVPGGSFSVSSGTSMAAPHVAGGWAVLKQAAPDATVESILSALQETGLSVTDTRGSGVTKPRVRLYQALSVLVPISHPVPSISSLSPGSATVGGASFTLSVNGSGFVASSLVRWNGFNRPTTVVSSNQVRATIPASDIATAGTAQVTVFTPSPGGGTSSAFPLGVTPPPAITVSATTVAPSASVTATVTDSPGGAGDWLGLYAVGAPSTSYLQFTYVGAGVTTRTWTVTMPTTPGPYEFRLLLNHGYTVAATSPTVTVSTSVSPQPVLSALSPSSGSVGGSAFTLTATGSGFVASSLVRWNGSDRSTTFISSTQLQAAIPATDLATAGTAQVTIFTPAPGGGTSAPRAFPVTRPPTITVSATTVAPGASVTATLTDAPGGPYDWLALAAVGAPETSYLQWVYVGSGVTTRTWTVTMPMTLGQYEFRLFLNNGYVRAATSPPVTVTP